MKKLIHHIRKQPEETRRHILHILIFIAGVILISLWIYSLGTNLTGPSMETKIIQDIKPLSALKENIMDGYNSMTEPNLGTEQTQ